MQTDKAHEIFLRRKAQRLGLLLQKSRARYWSINDQGEWMILDPNTNITISGEKFSLNIEDVEKYLDSYEEKLKITA